MKSVWMKVLVIIAAGVLLLITGFFLGARLTLYRDGDGLRVRGRDTGEAATQKIHHVTEPDVGYFSNIYIDTGFSDVEFINSDRYGIDLYGVEMEWQWTLENGTLNITSVTVSTQTNIDFRSTKRNHIKIFIPENTEFNKITIKSGNGDIDIGDFRAQITEINNSFGNVQLQNITNEHMQISLNSGSFIGSNINTRALVYNNHFGNGSFQTITAQTFTAHSNSGDLNFTGCKFEETAITISFGKITITDITSSKTDIRANSGDINITGDLSGETIIHADFGNINLTTSKEETDYSFDISVSFGRIRFAGERMRNETSIKSNDEKENHLKISSSSGDIDINFKE